MNVEDIDWIDRTITFNRKKTGSLAQIHFGSEAVKVLTELPKTGPLFPYLITVRPGDRATEFKQRCVGLDIKGVSLHSYRYAWAERAKSCGYPPRSGTHPSISLGLQGSSHLRCKSSVQLPG